MGAGVWGLLAAVLPGQQERLATFSCLCQAYAEPLSGKTWALSYLSMAGEYISISVYWYSLALPFLHLFFSDQ